MKEKNSALEGNCRRVELRIDQHYERKDWWFIVILAQVSLEAVEEFTYL